VARLWHGLRATGRHQTILAETFLGEEALQDSTSRHMMLLAGIIRFRFESRWGYHVMLSLRLKAQLRENNPTHFKARRFGRHD